MVIAGKKCPHPLLLKIYRFDEPKHYLSCIFNGLRLLREDQGIYPEYLHLSPNTLNLKYNWLLVQQFPDKLFETEITPVI
jgi:hypothetical protein